MVISTDWPITPGELHTFYNLCKTLDIFTYMSLQTCSHLDCEVAKKQVQMRWRPKLLSHLSNILATQCVNALQNGICKLFTAPAIAGKRGSRGVIYICNCPALSGPEQLSSATRMCCRLGSTQYLGPMFQTIDRKLVTCTVFDWFLECQTCRKWWRIL